MVQGEYGYRLALHRSIRDATMSFKVVKAFKTLNRHLKVGDAVSPADIDGVVTFEQWKERGFIVRKGEKSLISGITWVSVEGKEGEANDNGFKFPKEYHLFHRTQVEELKA